MLLRQPPLEVGAGVDAGRRMPLDEHHVARVTVVRRAPEVVEAHLVKRGRRGIARDVAAVLRALAVGLHHHRHGVPADVGLDAPLEGTVARVLALLGRRDRVDVGGVRPERQVGTGAARVVDDPLEQVVRPLRAVHAQHRVDRLEPLARLVRIGILDLRRFEHVGTRRDVMNWPARPASMPTRNDPRCPRGVKAEPACRSFHLKLKIAVRRRRVGHSEAASSRVPTPLRSWCPTAIPPVRSPACRMPPCGERSTGARAGHPRRRCWCRACPMRATPLRPSASCRAARVPSIGSSSRAG